MRKDFENVKDWSLDELGEALSDPINSVHRLYAQAEFTRRTTEVQTEAAKAMREVAASTSKKITIIVVLTAVLTLIFQLLSWLVPDPLHLH
jgi:hypothetical protein